MRYPEEDKFAPAVHFWRLRIFAFFDYAFVSRADGSKISSKISWTKDFIKDFLRFPGQAQIAQEQAQIVQIAWSCVGQASTSSGVDILDQFERGDFVCSVPHG